MRMFWPNLDWLADVHVWLKKVARELTNSVLLLAMDPCSRKMLIVASRAFSICCSSGIRKPSRMLLR